MLTAVTDLALLLDQKVYSNVLVLDSVVSAVVFDTLETVSLISSKVAFWIIVWLSICKVSHKFYVASRNAAVHLEGKLRQQKHTA